MIDQFSYGITGTTKNWLRAKALKVSRVHVRRRSFGSRENFPLRESSLACLAKRRHFYLIASVMKYRHRESDDNKIKYKDRSRGDKGITPAEFPRKVSTRSTEEIAAG